MSGSGKITGYGNNPEIRGTLNSKALNIDKTSPFEVEGQYEIITAASVRPYRADLQFKDFPVIALRKYVPKASLVQVSHPEIALRRRIRSIRRKRFNEYHITRVVTALFPWQGYSWRFIQWNIEIRSK